MKIEKVDNCKMFWDFIKDWFSVNNNYVQNVWLPL